MKTIQFIFFFFISTLAFSQTGSISGKITDSSFKKTMPYATVTVFIAKDTSIVTYRLCDPKGGFKITNLPLNVDLRFMVTFSGYEAYRKDFTLTANSNEIKFDSIILTPSARQLDDVIVYAERPPVMIKQDTIEFNASAFKTLPNALVEDLLKKLPGVQVDADGNITVNGKVVNKILVDGKTFFGDDPKMASRNLPANAIDKIQVTDDKEELLRNGDDNINNVGKVVNITLKKNVKKGMFGKVYAGGGTQGVYEAGGIANVYRDTLQVSLLGYANNLNKPGFSLSDLMQAGGFQRSNSNSNSNNTSIRNSGSGSNITINGINFGGIQNSGGVSTSKGIGFNINHTPSTKKTFFLQYFDGDIHVNRHNNTNIAQYSGDTVVNNNTDLTGDVVTHAHNFGSGFKLKPDSVTIVQFGANYTIGSIDDERFNTVYSNQNKLGNLSNGNINQNNISNTYYYRHSFFLTKTSKHKKGRLFTLSQNLDINHKNTDYTTDSRIHYTYPVSSDSLLNQLRSERLPNTTASFMVNYNEPLNKFLTLRFSSRYDYGKVNDDINTFNKNTDNKYDLLNDSFSNHFSRQSNVFNSSVAFAFKFKDLTIAPVARGVWQNGNNFLASPATSFTQRYSNFLPGLNIVYKQLSFNYSKGIFLPSYNYLVAVPDNTNPYFIQKGNINLVATERENYSINYYFNNAKKFFNVGLNGGGGTVDNDIVQNVMVNNKGVQTSTPVNVNGSKNFWLNYNINKQYKNNTRFIFSWNTGAYYEYNHSQLLYNGENSWQTTFNLQQWAGINLNFNDKVEWNSNFSMGYNFTDYTSKTFTPLQIINRYWNNELIVRLPKHLIWETQLNYSHNGSLPQGLKDVAIWNAALNITMLKDERGVLRISTYDLLNQAKSIYAFASGNTLTTRQSNVLPQYVMATFTYNFRPIGGEKKKVGGQRLLLF